MQNNIKYTDEWIISCYSLKCLLKSELFNGVYKISKFVFIILIDNDNDNDNSLLNINAAMK